MVKQLTVKEVLEKAIGKEVEARLFYTSLSRKTKQAAAKDALKELAKEEHGHQNLLERYLRGELAGGSLSQGELVDYKIAECLDQPAMSADMALKDVFLVAANREMASHEFYRSLAGIHPGGAVRTVLEDLAAQELKHKQRVEFLYTEVAFPQTAGG